VPNANPAPQAVKLWLFPEKPFEGPKPSYSFLEAACEIGIHSPELRHIPNFTLGQRMDSQDQVAATRGVCKSG
jgi:hypothetical protein